MSILIASYIVGWGGVAAGAYLGKKRHKKKYYAYGTAVYAFSWAMWAAGAYLVGPQGIALVKKLFRTYLWQTLVIAALILAAAAVYYFVLRKKHK